MAKKRIMIVEDENVVARDIEDSLKSLEYEVPYIASSGEKAIEKALQIRPDLILMDIVLKGKMDGMEAAKQIRSKLDIPVVYLTAYSDKKTLERAKKTEPFGYLLKPFEKKELRTSIEIALHRHEMEKEMEKKLKMNVENYRLDYQRIVDTAEEGVWIIDSKDRTFFVNKKMADMLGYTVSEMMGKSLYEFMDGEWKEKADDYAIRRRRGIKEQYDFKFSRKDGSGLWAFTSTSPIFAENGRYFGALGMVTDITERKQTEDELRHLKKSSDNASQEAVILEDSDGFITFANSRAQELLGYKEHLIGRHWTFLVPEEYHDLGKDKRAEIRKEGKVATYQSVLRPQDNGELIVLVSSSPQSENGIFSGVVSSYADITGIKAGEEREMEEKLKYDVKCGESYLIKEAETSEALDIFEDLVKNGFEGLIISRTHPSKIKARCPVDAPILWLSSRETAEDCIRPDFQLLEETIKSRVVRSSVLLIDRLDYLIMQTGFRETVGFIHRIAEFMLIRKGVLLLQIDDATLSEQERSIIEKETSQVSRKKTLPAELSSTLDFIRSQNDIGKKPSYVDVNNAFDITENTCRKRIRKLESLGFLKEVKHGRYKLLELTEKGKKWF